ncbi:MAG: hypothetical protein AAF628_17015 [Planctomycetota bacterium]
MLRSFFETTVDGEVALLAFGDSFARITGGLWETVTTDAEGRFRLTGLGADVTALRVKVAGPARQVSPARSKIYWPTGVDMSLILRVE